MTGSMNKPRTFYPKKLTHFKFKIFFNPRYGNCEIQFIKW